MTRFTTLSTDSNPARQPDTVVPVISHIGAWKIEWMQFVVRELIAALLAWSKSQNLSWSMQYSSMILPGTRPSIKPDTITSFSPSKIDTDGKDDTQSPVASQDAVVPSSCKKLISKTNQADKVLTYLKASVSMYQLVGACHFCVIVTITFLGDPVLSVQDEAAKEMHKENKVMKKQLIGLLAKVNKLFTHKVKHPVMSKWIFGLHFQFIFLFFIRW